MRSFLLFNYAVFRVIDNYVRDLFFKFYSINFKLSFVIGTYDKVVKNTPMARIPADLFCSCAFLAYN